MELGLPSANWALTFVLSTVVAVAVCRTEVSRHSLGRWSGARAALHPGPLTTKRERGRRIIATNLELSLLPLLQTKMHTLAFIPLLESALLF